MLIPRISSFIDLSRRISWRISS